MKEIEIATPSDFSRTASESVLQSEPDAPRDTVDAPGDELGQQIIEVFRAARRGLTDDSLAAVFALRHKVSILKAIEELLLEGELDAEMIDKNKDVLETSNFIFRTWPQNEETTPEVLSEAAA